MIILGINAWHGDSAACLVRDGRLVAAAEEERFRRVKHWAGLPTESVAYCLREGGVRLGDVDVIAVNRRPATHLLRRALFALAHRPRAAAVRDRVRNAARIGNVGALLAAAFGENPEVLARRVRRVEHHRAHLASAFLVSPFREAALVSVDGFGDFVSTMWGRGEGARIAVEGEVHFPHSLGLFYLAVTQHLGFLRYGDEYKVMGLAPYGKPAFAAQMRRLVRALPDGRFALGLEHFCHHTGGTGMLWEGGEPRIGKIFTPALEGLLGPSRAPGDPLEERHRDLAASVQRAYEEIFFHVVDHAQRVTGSRVLCLAGGCAMNSVANGKIFERTGFRDLFIQSAAGDAGGAVGAAYWVWNVEQGRERSYEMGDAYLGPAFADGEVGALLEARRAELRAAGCTVERVEDEKELCRRAATSIAAGRVVGWFQGRMEWGPRALGNRSILGDPRRADMQQILNMKIKRRESFRPFAPSILRERVAAWFETDYDVPFMLQVYRVREEKRPLIPAVTHVDGSGRLQTVTERQNPRYFGLIRAFEERTGVPAVLNTSFNENEPVVCRPEEALDCFLRTGMDTLVLGSWVLERSAGAEGP